MDIQSAKGQYTFKQTGETFQYDFEYKVFTNIEDAVESIGEAECLKLIQRQTKVDANNVSREKAKTANSHSTRPVMSESEKADKKAQRAEDKVLLDRVKSLSPEQREALGI